MMRPINLIIRYSFIILLSYASAPQALSIEKNPTGQATKNSNSGLQNYVWYDGQKKRSVWLNPNLVANFQKNSAQTELLKKNYPEARIKRNHRSVRIWQLTTQPISNISKTNSKNSSRPIPSGYSAVFHDNPTDAARMRSLPGNIIVYLNPVWNEEQIADWIASRDLVVIKKIEIRPNAYLLKSEPGIQTLQMANELFESGDVVAAFPDWWLESTTR